MIKLSNFLNLIRFKNLVIIILMQMALKLFLINSYLNHPCLSNYDFSLYLFSLITIVAAGYIINDVYDIETDKINKPKKRIVDKKIKKTTALQTYFMLNTLGLTTGFYIAYKIDKLWFGLMFVLFAYNLFKYSKIYKNSFLIGNIQIASLIALSIINLAIFDLNLFESSREDGTIGVFYIILIYSAFSFIMTLIREIIKDIEDVKGDMKIGSNTLAITYGNRKTKRIIKILTVSIFVVITYFQYIQYSILTHEYTDSLSHWGVNKFSVAYTLFLQILIIRLLIKISKADTIIEFHSTSKLCKTIMIIGILSIPLFNLLHQK